MTEITAKALAEPKASSSGGNMTDAQMIAWLMSTLQYLQAGTHPGVTGVNYALMGLCEDAAARIARLAQDNTLLRTMADETKAVRRERDQARSLCEEYEEALNFERSNATAAEAALAKAREGLNAIIDRGPERHVKWTGMSAKDIAFATLGAIEEVKDG